MHRGTEGTLLDPGEQILGNRNVDIGFEKRQPDLTERLVDIGLRQPTFAA